MRRMPLESDDRFRLRLINELLDVESSPGNPRPLTSQVLEFAMDEYLRGKLDERFNDAEDDLIVADVVRQVVATARDEVLSHRSRQSIAASVSGAIEEARIRLENNTTKIADLASLRVASMRAGRLRRRARSASKANEYTVEWVGLEGALDGVLIRPARQVEALDLAPDGAPWSLDPDASWFPFELLLDDARVVVVEEDGTLFVSVRGLSRRERDSVESQLLEVADALYV